MVIHQTANNFIQLYIHRSKVQGAVVAVITWQLDLKLPMQSVPITIGVVSSNLNQGEVHNIMFDRSVVSTVSSTNKTDRHDITAILLKVALNTIKQTIKSTFYFHIQIVPYIFHINHLFSKRSLEDILHPIVLKFSTLKAELISLF